MTAHLLLISLGPVQDFIAQARRTRDLWYGSHLLSELSRAAARELDQHKARLIFPALGSANLSLDAQASTELVPCLHPLRASGVPPRNVANKLLAELPAGLGPEGVAREVRHATTRFLRDDIANTVKATVGTLVVQGAAGDAVWDEQVATLLEFSATWAPLGEYGETRALLETALAGRKNLRDFQQYRCSRPGAPKSSLDGARETLLQEPRHRPPKQVRRYRIAEGEQLDAVGVIKRAGGTPEQFVPIVNVALGPWLDLARETAPPAWNALDSACRTRGVAKVVRSDLRCGQSFGFDAGVVFPSRWRALFEEQGLGTPKDAEDFGRRKVQPLLKAMVEPYPYVACLVADGDRMGEALDQLHSADEHRAFSSKLAGFADLARTLVEQECRGSLVYAGGDDVVAFLPLEDALTCAERLRRGFANVMAQACSALPATSQPTFSVGIGIGHVMEGMGELLGLGRQAEKLAKGHRWREARQDRNALAVIVDKRSGGRRSYRCRWDAPAGHPVARLVKDAALLGGAGDGPALLTTRKLYEIAQTLRKLPEPNTPAARNGAWRKVLELEVLRSLRRVDAGSGAGGPTLEDVGLALSDSDDYPTLHEAVSTWVERMLIASTFARAIPRAKSASPPAARRVAAQLEESP